MSKTRYYRVFSILFLGVFVSAAALFHGSASLLPERAHAAQISSDIPPAGKLSEEELVTVVKPSVVRIVKHVEGEASIASFKINLKDFTIHSVPGEKPLVLPVKIDITGSGFVVNPDGYILTNSHVISENTVKMRIVEPLIDYVLRGELSSLNSADAQKIDKERTQEEGFTFGQEILDYVISKSTFNLTTTITVLNPTSEGNDLAELIKSGFQAEVVSLNEDWYKNERDVGVLKIEEKNLPSLRIADSKDISVGNQVYVFGFPSSAEFNRNNLLESTFTKGVVSAIKSSQGNDFKIFQTDAKISTGSSGGPLFDSAGHVAGLVTFETSASDQSNGDNFAFAIPIEIAKESLSGNFIINDEGEFGPRMRAGLEFMREKHCKNAIAEFTAAKNVNEKFGVNEYVDPYIEKCSTLIASGLSIDSKWDEIRQRIHEAGALFWALLAAGVFLLVMLGVIGAIFWKRLKKDKVELEHLEHVIEHRSEKEEATTSAVSPAFTVVVEKKETVAEKTSHLMETAQGVGNKNSSAPNPELLSYIKAARQSGLTFQAINQELKKAGWSDDEIARALAVPE